MANFTEQEEFEFALAREKELQLPAQRPGAGLGITDFPISTIAAVAKEGLKQGTAPFRAAGRGFVRGATFGVMGQPSDEGLAGSVMEPAQQKRERLFGKTGEYAGMIMPFIASEMTGGAALAGAAAMRGASVGGQAVAKMAGTGLTYGAARGAAQGLPLSETVKGMAIDAATFSGLSIGGQFLGYLRKLFGEKLAEGMANAFINTPRNVAEKLVEQGKPSLGKQYLTKSDLSGFRSREEVYAKAKGELGRLENQIGGRLEANLEKLKTPTPPTPAAPGTPLLPYAPTEIAAQAEQAAQFPPGQVARLPAVPKFREPTVGTIPSPTVPGEEGILTVGGRVGGRFVKGKARGEFLAQTPEEIAAESVKARSLARFAVEKYGLKELPETPFAVTREGVISTGEIASSLDDVAAGFKTGTRRGEVAKINNLKASFLEDNPGRLTLSEAMALKRKLDDTVSRAYLNPATMKTPVLTQVDETLANVLRRKIYEVDPELGAMAAKESLLIRINTGMKFSIAGVGGRRLPHGLYSALSEAFGGSSTANLMAKVLTKTMGTPSTFIAPATRRAAQIGIEGIRTPYNENQ